MALHEVLMSEDMMLDLMDLMNAQREPIPFRLEALRNQLYARLRPDTTPEGYDCDHCRN